MNGIIFLTEHYFFLKTSSLTPNENRMYRRVELERQAIKALIKYSTEETHTLTSYFPDEQNDIISWLNVTISECSKRRNRNKLLKTGQ